MLDSIVGADWVWSRKVELATLEGPVAFGIWWSPWLTDRSPGKGVHLNGFFQCLHIELLRQTWKTGLDWRAMILLEERWNNTWTVPPTSQNLCRDRILSRSLLDPSVTAIEGTGDRVSEWDLSMSVEIWGAGVMKYCVWYIIQVKICSSSASCLGHWIHYIPRFRDSRTWLGGCLQQPCQGGQGPHWLWSWTPSYLQSFDTDYPSTRGRHWDIAPGKCTSGGRAKTAWRQTPTFQEVFS